jgi:hypothetical protein
MRFGLVASCLGATAAGWVSTPAVAAPVAPSEAPAAASAASQTPGESLPLAPVPVPATDAPQTEAAPPPAAALADAPAPPIPMEVTSSIERELDRILSEAARDLGIDLAYQQSALDGPVDEERLLANAGKGYALGAELRPARDGLLLRLLLVKPGRGTIYVGRVHVNEETLEVSAIRLLQQLTEEPAEPPPEPRPEPPPPQRLPPHRSAGKAVLTAHGALVGGYLGFSLEHIAGAGDARLVFPLMTLGAGAGVGASLVVAEEWDISPGEAWYVWAAGTWATVSGRLIASATGDATDSRLYGYGLLGTAAGLTLGSVALNTGEVSPGGALLTHSGALFGAHFGALAQMLARGDTSKAPTLGLGVGMGTGLVVAGAVAPHIDSLSASRVLFVDVSAILGGLAGAALASPILVGDKLSPGESRIWLGSIALGTVTGAVVGTLVTSGETDTPMFSWRPYFDVVSGPTGTTRGAVSVTGLAGKW